MAWDRFTAMVLGVLVCALAIPAAFGCVGVGAVAALAVVALSGWAGKRWLLSRRLNRMRANYRAGLCMRCGYDVRANDLRCPECGDELLGQVASYYRDGAR